MKRPPLSLTLTLTATSLLALTASQAADFRWTGTADAGTLNNPANWDVVPAGATAANLIIPSGDRVFMNQAGAGAPFDLGTPANLVTVQGGGQLVMDGGGWGRIVNSQINLAPNGIIAATGGGGDSQRVTHINLTGTNSTSYLITDNRMDIRDGGLNQVNFGSNNTLEQSTSNGQGLNFVFTSWLGSGALKMTGGYLSLEDGFAGSPTVTIDASNTNITSWAGHNDTITSPIILRNSQINGRYEDFGKQYNGAITIPAGSTGTFNPEMNGNPNQQGVGATPGNTNDQSIVVNGGISGGGTLSKVGGGTLFLNTTNTHSGGSNITGGTVVAGATDALGTGPVTLIAGTTLNTNTFSQGVNGGNIAGTVSGSGGIRSTGGTTVISSLNVSSLAMGGGTVVPTVNNALGNSTVVVSENSILKPTNQTLNFHYESNNLDGAQNDAVYGAGLHVNDPFNPNALLGAVNGTIPGQTNIAQIDGTGKPFGNYTRYTYTGQLNNTGGSNINLSFGEQYDDEARVIIDGVDVLNDTGWNTATSTSNRIGQPGINADGTYTLTPGAHNIIIQAFDGWGGAGPNSGWDKGIGWREGAHAITDPGGGADNGQFMRIGTGTVPNAALKFSDGADKSFNQNFSLNAGKTLTVDTSDMLGGNKVILTGVLSGAGGLAKAGLGTAQLNGVNLYSGTTTVSQGTLKIAAGGSIANSLTIDVAAGATLDVTGAGFTVGSSQSLVGNGTVSGGLTVAGDIAPGNSVGTLTLSGGSLTISGDYEGEASANGINDLIIGDVIWAAGAEFNLTLLGGYSPALGDSLDFINGSISGTAPTLNLPALTGDKTWNTSQFMSVGVLSVIPEPATFSLGLLGLGLLARRRR